MSLGASYFILSDYMKIAQYNSLSIKINLIDDQLWNIDLFVQIANQMDI